MTLRYLERGKWLNQCSPKKKDGDTHPPVVILLILKVSMAGILSAL